MNIILLVLATLAIYFECSTKFNTRKLYIKIPLFLIAVGALINMAGKEVGGIVIFIGIVALIIGVIVKDLSSEQLSKR